MAGTFHRPMGKRMSKDKDKEARVAERTSRVMYLRTIIRSFERDRATIREQFDKSEAALRVIGDGLMEASLELAALEAAHEKGGAR